MQGGRDQAARLQRAVANNQPVRPRLVLVVCCTACLNEALVVGVRTRGRKPETKEIAAPAGSPLSLMRAVRRALLARRRPSGTTEY
jgi:hypothetical protein